MTARDSGKHAPALAPTADAADAAQGYEFTRYVTRKRMMSFWYQLTEIMRLDVPRVLEVGIGPRVVTGVLRELGKQVKTADINPALAPDYLVPVQRLSSVVPPDSFDLVLCARVLHHVPFEELDTALAELQKVTRRYVILTVPVDALWVYIGFSVTARPWRWFSLRLPLWLKRLLLRLMRQSDSAYARSWKLDCCAESTLRGFEQRLSRFFTIEKSYAIPEAKNHHLFVLSKRL